MLGPFSSNPGKKMKRRYEISPKQHIVINNDELTDT
jgi:hypothetical protein